MDDARMKKSAAVRQGLVILGILAALTLIEYFVGVFIPWGWLLLLLALLAANADCHAMSSTDDWRAEVEWALNGNQYCNWRRARPGAPAR